MKGFQDLGEVPCALDSGIAPRAAIGLVALATDQTIEYEFRQLITAPGASYYVSRIWNDADITPESLRAIGKDIAEGTRLILPGLPLDVVAFGCTSATMTLGEEAVFGEIRKARPEVACTTPITAAFAAFRAFGAKRIGILTPYADAVNQIVRRYFEDHGMEVGAFATFNKLDDREAARISLDSIAEAAAALAASTDLDAIFISCTSMRLSDRIVEIERRAGVPVTSSDHALAWHCLRLGGVTEAMPASGQLFQLTI